MSWIDTGGICHGLIPQLDVVVLFELLQSSFIDGPHGFRKVPVKLRVVQIKIVPVVMNDPGKNGVLREIVEGSVSLCVYKH